MTHRIEVNCETGETTIIEYTPEEQAAYDAAVAAQALAEAQAAAAAVVVTPTEPVVTPSEPTL